MDNTTLQKAKEAIEAALTEHKVTLVPVVIHRGDQTIASIDIVPTVTPAVEEAPDNLPVE